MTGVEWTRCACGRRFQRPRRATYAVCLPCQTDQRLMAAGICWAGLALTAVREWNAGIQGAELEAVR